MPASYPEEEKLKLEDRLLKERLEARHLQNRRQGGKTITIRAEYEIINRTIDK